VGQCVCIKTKKDTETSTKYPFRYLRARINKYTTGVEGGFPFLPRFKNWDMLPRVISLYALEFLSISDLGAMCLVAKQYQLLLTQRLEQYNIKGINPAMLNQDVRLHQLCMDQLHTHHTYIRVLREITVFI
jgi:hypothetical protein